MNVSWHHRPPATGRRRPRRPGRGAGRCRDGGRAHPERRRRRHRAGHVALHPPHRTRTNTGARPARRRHAGRRGRLTHDAAPSSPGADHSDPVDTGPGAGPHRAPEAGHIRGRPCGSRHIRLDHAATAHCPLQKRTPCSSTRSEVHVGAGRGSTTPRWRGQRARRRRPGDRRNDRAQRGGRTIGRDRGDPQAAAGVTRADLDRAAQARQRSGTTAMPAARSASPTVPGPAAIADALGDRNRSSTGRFRAARTRHRSR